MSTNHVSMDLPEATPWAQHHHHQPIMIGPSIKPSSRKQDAFISRPNNNNTIWGNNTMFCTQKTAFSFNLNHEDDEELDEQLINEREKDQEDDDGRYKDEEEIPKEPLFEKPLTPSDVGKLNRLVIPKQHAEKYFPLSSSTSNDSGDQKALLLNFEDESGKSWRFRYSYWNSSQSYVLTKGWSRFVKEKRLDAGDVVTFERHRLDGYRFFIGWRRKNTPVPTNPVHYGGVAQPATVAVAGGGWTPIFHSTHSYPSQSHGPHQLPYQPDCLHAGSAMQNNPTAPSGHPKRLRLFGVNLEWVQPEESEPSTPDGSSMSSQGAPHYLHQYHQNHMEINFSSRDVNQIRYHQR